MQKRNVVSSPTLAPCLSPMPCLSVEEIILIRYYRLLSDRGRRVVLDTLSQYAPAPVQGSFLASVCPSCALDHRCGQVVCEDPD